MKIKRTLPSIEEMINKKEQEKKKRQLRRRGTMRINENSKAHIELINEEEQVGDEEMVQKILKSKPKIFEKTSKDITEDKIGEEKQNQDQYDFKLPSKQSFDLKDKSSHDNSLKRKSIFQNKSFDAAGEGIFTNDKSFTKEKGKLQKKVVELEKVVEQLEKRLNEEGNNPSMKKYMKKIQQLQRSDQKKDRDLKRMSLELKQHERCQKIARENQILYSRLASTLKMGKSGIWQDSNKFPSYHETPRNGDGQDENQICSPFMIQRELSQRASYQNSFMNF